jgi:hypothetical protein
VVSYTATGNDFSVGKPILLCANITIQVSNPPQLFFLSVYVKPDNAFVQVDQTTGPRPTPSVIYLFGPTNFTIGTIVEAKNWIGCSVTEIDNAGPFGATVYITAIPTPSFWNQASPSFQAEKPFHTEIATIVISPSGAMQQQFYENENVSLTIFILFFASVDIAVALHDQAYETIETNPNYNYEECCANSEEP